MIDPAASKYLDCSPYNYASNNPLRIIDPNGKEIITLTGDDAKEFLRDLKTVFANEKFNKFRELLMQSGKSHRGNGVSKIDDVALKGALEGTNLSLDEQLLVDIVVNTINSKEKHMVEYANKSDFLSELQLKGYMVDQRLIDALNGSVAASFLGSRTAPTSNGTRSIIVNDDLSGEDYFNSETKSMIGNPASKAGTTMHEVFGHGRSFISRKGDKNQHVDAIQLENLVLRIMGHGNIQRTGEGHGDRTKIPNASARPGFQ